MLFGFLTWLLQAVAHHAPQTVERWYSRGFFQGIRVLLDWTTGLLPVSPFYLFWLAVLAYWIVVIRKGAPVEGRWRKAGYWMFKLAGFAALMYGLFFWMWGFNYARTPLVRQIGLKVQPLDTAMLWRDLEAETRALDSLRNAFAAGDTQAMNDRRFWPQPAEDSIRSALERWLAGQGFPVGGRVRARSIWPPGLLYKFGASGLYWPFIGEGNLEAGLHPLQQLPVMAHEMSHGYGFSDEGICNFTAYAACYRHPNPYVAYCARLDFWRTLAVNCRESDPERYKTSFLPLLPKGVLADLHAIEQQQEKFSEFAPKLRYELYDNYLKAQGIESGMLNYEEVLMLVHAWKSSMK